MDDPVAHREAAPDPTESAWRATVRYRLADGSATDVIGMVEQVDAERLVVVDRSGVRHTIRRADVIVARRVPLVSRGRDPLRTSAAELERLASACWHDREEPLGEWLLRSAGGVTLRANSCLAVGDPGMAVAAAAATAVTYATTQRIRPVAQVITGSDEERALGELGWRPFRADVSILAMRLSDLCALGRGRATVSAHADDDWLRQYVADHPADAGSDQVRRLLDCADPAFASTRHDGALVAMGRANQVRDWTVLTALWTVPSLRRRGLMRDTVLTLAWWAAARGARSVMLQTAGDNLTALTAYRRLGFTEHHGYRYLTPRSRPARPTTGGLDQRRLPVEPAER